MPGFDGTGPNGMGPMTGGGRGYCNPAGRRFAGWPSWMRRGTSYGWPRYGAYGYQPLAPGSSREQELEFLKGQAEALRGELNEIEAEIGKLSVAKSQKTKGK
jgi:hypothetical protein